jgi:competence protein ComEC
MNNKKELVIKFLNVGQGDSTHIVLPTGDHMLIDINLDHKNRGIDVIQYLADVLPAAGKKKRLAYNVNTHPHDDHIRGTGALGHDFDIGEMWHSGHKLDCENGDNPEYDKFLAVIEDLGDKAREIDACSDPVAEIGDVKFTAFRPSSHVKLKKTDEHKREAIHDECMVLKLEYAGFSVMFSGDTNKGAWESIVKHYDEAQLRSNVLHASHHASRTFFKKKCEEDEAWKKHLDAISPESIVISVGAENPHGHPHPDMLKEYEARAGKTNVYRTDQNLTVTLTVDESGHATWEMDDEEFQKKYELPDPGDDGDAGKREAAERTSAAILSKTRLGDKSPTA